MKKQITSLLAVLFLLAAAGNDLVAQPTFKPLKETPENFYVLKRQLEDRTLIVLMDYYKKYPSWYGGTPEGFERWKKLNRMEKLKRIYPPFYREVQAFAEWEACIEPRLYPSGEFVDASDLMTGEMRRLQKGGRLSGAKLPQSCNPMASWSNLGPFYTNANTPQHNTGAGNTGMHGSSIPGLGRVNFVRKHPTENLLYIGTPNGGLWKSPDGGATWELATAELGITGLADLAFSADGTVMYLATGDRSRGGAEFIGTTTYSRGVLKSTDGGASWTPLADRVYWQGAAGAGELTESEVMKINRIALNASGELLAGTGDNLRTAQPDAGVWRYEPQPDGPGGETVGHWVLKLETFREPVREVLVLPGNVVLAATVEVEEASYERLYRSTNGGQTYSLVSSGGFPTPVPDPMTGKVDPFVGNVGMAYSNGVLYIMFLNSVTGQYGGLHRSVDAGQTFEFVSMTNPTFQSSGIGDGIRRLGFTVNPGDANELYVSGSRKIWKLSVAWDGNNWEATASEVSKESRHYYTDDDFYVHNDVQEFQWDGNTLYAAHDGGLSKTTDYGVTWSKWYELTGNLCISEVYRMGALPGSADVLFAGTHDNGAFRYSAAAATGEPFWLNIESGDQLKAYPQTGEDVLFCNVFGEVQRGRAIYQTEIGGNLKVCDGSGYGATTTTLTASGGTAYLWEDGSTDAVRVGVPRNTPGSYYWVTVTDGGSFFATAWTGVEGLPGECGSASCFAEIRGDLSVCDGSGYGATTTTLTASGGGTDYTWEDGSTDAVRPGLGPGTYSVTVTDGAGCTETASATVSEVPGECFELENSNKWNVEKHKPPTSDRFGNGVHLPFVQSPDDAEVLYLGYYNLWKSVDGGDTWTNTTGYPVTVPENQKVINTIAVAPSNADVMYYSKRKSEDSGLNNPRTPLVYKSADCTATATVTVSDDSGQCSPGPCTAAIKGDLVVCDGSVSGGGTTTTLTASGGTGYLWEDGSTDAVRTNVGEGSYAVTVTDGVSCTATASAAVVGAGSGCGGVLCTAVIKGDLVVCDGSGSGPTTTTLTASGGTSYLWEDGSTDAVRTNVGVGNYSVTVTDGAGSSWDLVYDGGNTNPDDNLPQLHLNQLAVHPFDPDKLWAVFSGYEAGERVYESADGGATWRNVSGELPPLPVNAVAAFAEDPGDPGSLVHLVVGTDLSVYYSNETLLSCSGGAQWFDFGQGFPYIIVQELEVHGSGANRVLRAATRGRGAWESRLPSFGDCTC